MAYILVSLSLLALGFAVYLALDMRRERLARLDRIARAVRPVHGRPMRAAPVRSTNRPGED